MKVTHMKQHRARGTGQDPSLHCWHQMGAGSLAGNKIECRAICCRCGQLADLIKWCREAPVEGHGEYHTITTVVSIEAFGYATTRLPWHVETPLLECLDGARDRQEEGIEAMVEQRRKARQESGE